MKPILSLLLCLFAATAWATDPPAFSLANTPYGLSFLKSSFEVVSEGGNKYSLHNSAGDAPAFPASAASLSALNSYLAANIGNSVDLVALQMARGWPVDQGDRAAIVASHSGLPNLGLPLVDLQVLVVDEGDGKYSGQFKQTVSGVENTYSAKLYTPTTATQEALHVTLGALVGEIVTVRGLVLTRGIPLDLSGRVVVVMEVNP